MIVSGLWIPFTRDGDVLSLGWLFTWSAGLWIMFPIGAFFGGWLMPRLRLRTLPRAVVFGLGIGLLTGVVLTGLIVGIMKADALIGLIQNAGGGGYESYRYSVLKNLRELTWNIGKALIPVTAVTFVVWALVKQRRGNRTAASDTNSTTKFPLLLTSWHAVWWLGMAVILAVLVGFMIATHNGELKQIALGTLGGAGVTIVGPMIGPMINPGGGNTFATKALIIALPFIVLSLLPFILKFSVHRRAAAIYWCIYITIMLMWTCLGVFSACMSMG